MRRTLLALIAALSLSACVEVDMTLEVLGQDDARAVGFMQMNRQMFDMSGGDASFCDTNDGGTLSLSNTHARCDFVKRGTFAEILTLPDQVSGPGEAEGELVWLGDNRVRALFPMQSLATSTDEMRADPQMEAMMRQMLSGLSIKISIAAREVESSTGTISDDRTRATITLGVDQIFDGTASTMGDFESIVKF